MDQIGHLPLSLLAITVPILIWCELKQTRARYVLKPLSTALVLSLPILSWQAAGATPSQYDILIISGLLVSIFGDSAMLFKDTPKYLRMGIAFFLITHILYTVAFWGVTSATSTTAYLHAGVFVISLGLYAYLYRGLGSMRAPVLVYVVVIAMMLSAGLSTHIGETNDPRRSTLIVLGVILFYVSDGMLAVNQFKRPFSWNRLSLAPYYAGQILIALSTG